MNRRLVAPWTAPNAQATPAPDDRVEIELPIPCATGPLFGPGVSIEIRFLQPVPGPTASPSWMEVTTDRLLRFTVPDTGRAGPVDVVVMDASKTKIAEVGPLYQATSSCNPGPPDETFGQLTVLPPANDVRALAAGTAPLVMTVDGNGGLLVPLVHPFPVPTAAPLGPTALVAFLERGAGDFQALSAPMRTLAQALASAQQPDDATLSKQLVRTFTVHGRPLPALVHVDASGAVWGSVDAPRSVLRVAPRDAASNPLQDLAQQLDPQGHIVVTPRPTASPQPWAAATSAPFLLPDLRGGERVVAWVRDERIEGEFDGTSGLDGTRVETVHASRAGRNVGFGLSAVARDGTGRAILGTGRSGGAFLAPDSGNRARLYAYTLRQGGTPMPKQTPADLRARINRRGLALTDPLVFFGKYTTAPNPKLQSFDLDSGTYQDAGLPAFDRSAVGTGCSVALAASNGEAWWHCRSKTSSKSAKLGVIGDDIAIAGRLVVVAAHPSPSPGVVLRAIRPTGSPGPLYRIAQAASAVGATAYCDPSGIACDDTPCPSGERCRRFGVFLAPLPSPSLGSLIWVAEPTPGPTPGPTPVPVAVQAASDFVTRGGIIAFRSPRTSGSGKELFTLDLRQQPPRLCSTGSTATTPGAVDWDDFYEIRGNDVLFLTDEQDEGRDLDGDGKVGGLVLQMFDVEGCSDPNLLGVTSAAAAMPIGSVVAPADVEPGVVRVSGGAMASTLFADEDADGVPYPFDRCAVVPNPRQIDDDLDGLGDGAQSCDPTYCTPYQPPPVRLGGFADRRCRRRLRTATRGYFEDRAAVVNLCLPMVASTGSAAGDERAGDAACRGTFASLTENRPAVVRAVVAAGLGHGPLAESSHGLAPDIETSVTSMVRAEARLREIADQPPCHDRVVAARIVRANAEAVAAMTRAATVLGANDVASRLAATAYVRDAVGIMEDCLGRCRLFPPSGATLAAECLGHIEGTPGHVTFVPPRHHGTAQRLAAAQKALVAALPRGDCQGRADRSCPAEVACLGWRRAVDVVLASH